MTSKPTTFAARLRTLREARGYSLSQLQERSGVSKGNLNRYENGHREPVLSTLLKIAAGLEASMLELCGK